MPPPRLGVNNILTPFLPAALGEPLPCQQGLRGFTTREAAKAWGYALWWTPSFGQVFVTAKVESRFMIQATLG